jgi:cytochrome P450
VRSPELSPLATPRRGSEAVLQLRGQVISAGDSFLDPAARVPERLRARYGPRFTVRFPLAPPFVIITHPDEIREVFIAPPDVLHPGEGARVLEPLVGKNSVIPLDEAAHMEQRRLLLPAFHGERMAALSGLMTEVAEREVASWPRDGEISLQPRMQRLTLEIILRAVFGLDPGPRLNALRDRLADLLAFGDRAVSWCRPTRRARPPRCSSGSVHSRSSCVCRSKRTGS